MGWPSAAALGYWTTPVPPPLNEVPIALASCVTPDYLKVIRIPLRQGRFFDDHDRADTEAVVVIDEVLVQHAFPGQDAVGKRLFIQAMGAGSLRVIGVVGDRRSIPSTRPDLLSVCTSPRPLDAFILFIHVNGCAYRGSPFKPG